MVVSLQIFDDTVKIDIMHRVKMHIFDIAYSLGGTVARLVGFSIEIS